MGKIAEQNRRLNQAINQGQVLDVFKDIYHPNVTMEEATGERWTGLDENYEREQSFFGNIQQAHEAKVTETAVDEDKQVSFANMRFDLTMKDGSRVKLDEVAERHWKDGRIIRERFFYNPEQG